MAPALSLRISEPVVDGRRSALWPCPAAVVVAVGSKRVRFMTRHRDRRTGVVVLALQPYGVGGVETATRSVIGALARSARLNPVRVHAVLRGSQPSGEQDEFVASRGATSFNRFSKVRFVLRLVASCLWRPPRLLVATHASLAVAAVVIARVVRGKTIVIVHGREVWAKGSRLQRWAIEQADQVWSPSRFTSSELERWAHPADVRHIPWSVDMPELGETERIPRSVVAVARLDRAVRYKGIDRLLHVWSIVSGEIADASLAIVGDGDDRAYLEALAVRLDLEPSVLFRGRLSADDLDRILRSSEVFILLSRLEDGPSRGGEGFGLAYIEAAAYGLAVIGAAEGGSAEVLHPDWARIVDPTDIPAVAAVLSELLQSPSEIRRLGRMARLVCEHRFSNERFLREVIESSEELIDPRDI